MGKLIGFLLFMLGLVLLADGMTIPQGSGTAWLRVLIGLSLIAAGYIMADFSGARRLLSFMVFLIALLGLSLLGLGLLPQLIGVSLYGGFLGSALRAISGIMLCVGAYVAYELGDIG